MALLDYDRKLLSRCISGQPNAWEEFVDRFLGLVVHVIDHTAQARSIKLADQDREDLTAEVFLGMIANDFAILRRFRGESSLATYLTVVARRMVVREILRRRIDTPHQSLADRPQESGQSPDAEKQMHDQEEVQRLIEGLSENEAAIVKLHHLDGLSYQEISQRLGVPANSIGPILTRARSKMKRLSTSS